MPVVGPVREPSVAVVAAACGIEARPGRIIAERRRAVAELPAAASRDLDERPRSIDRNVPGCSSAPMME